MHERGNKFSSITKQKKDAGSFPMGVYHVLIIFFAKLTNFMNLIIDFLLPSIPDFGY